MGARLYVGNLSYKATEDGLREHFGQAGTVQSVAIITDRETGRSRGFAFVEMATKEEADKAVETLNGQPYLERQLVVNEAKPRPERDDRGRGGDRRNYGY